MASDNPVYIVDATRSPFLKAVEPGPFSAADLAVQTGRHLLARQPFEAPVLDQVILGCAAPTPDEMNIARIVSLRLGCGHRVPAWSVHRNCASGMQAVDSAATDIATGRAGLVLAGGTEAMSHAPLLFHTEAVRWFARLNRSRGTVQRLRQLLRFRPGYLKPVIGLLRGLRDPVSGLSMGQTAEEVANRFGIDREAMDRYALDSHQRLGAAMTAGNLDEIQPVYDDTGNHYDRDTGWREDASMERLARLKPVFDPRIGRVTAGNSAQVTDGAAWLLLAGEAAVRRYGLTILGRIVDSQWAGLDPAQMGLGPVHASTPLLERHGYGLADIDAWEINEAFAAQVLGCLAAWRDAAYCRDELNRSSAMGEIDPGVLNVDGGAISVGHPVGASGARILLHLLTVLRRKHVKTGIASLCIGGGQGGAMLLEAR